MGEFALAFEMGIRLAVLVLIVAIIGAAIIGRIIEGELSGSQAVIALLFVAGLLIGVVLFWNSPFVFVVFLLAGGLISLWLLAHVAAERKLTQQIRTEDEARYKAVIGRDPKNAAAWSSLGNLYLEMRRYDDAIECLEQALQIMPDSPDDKHKLRWAKRLKAEAETKTKPCPQCKTPLSRSAITCPQCGYELSAPLWAYFLAAAVDKVAMRKVVIALLIALPVATILFAFLSMLNPFWRAIVILATLAAIGIVLLIELRG